MAFVAFGQSTQQKQQGPTKSGRIALVLLTPGLAYLGLFFITPLISLITTSLKTASASGVIGRYDFALEFGNYAFAIGQYAPQIFRSFAYALIATIVALLISYPIAYFIGVKARNKP
ncbi:MAG: ABC transporter permease, partial [Aquiluna sp.]|nr:ABC transporter permease [Aquiluna sp.]